MVAVEIRGPDLTLIPHWEALAKRTSANVFMHPAALCAAAAAGFAKVHVLLAWDGERLVGLWALRERRLRFLPAFLAAPPYEYAFLASPVIDPEYAGAVMVAFLDAIAKARALPNVIERKLLDGDDASLGALLIDKASDALFASGTETIESCSPAGSFMEHLWTGRRATMDMLVDVSARKSLAFRLAAAGERIYALARDLRDRTRAVSWPLPKRKSLAVTRS